MTEMGSVKDGLVADCTPLVYSEFFKQNGDFLPFVPCLRSICPQLPRSSNPITRQMTSGQRWQLAFEFLKRLLQHALSKLGMVLIFENVQKMIGANLQSFIFEQVIPIVTTERSLVVMTCRALTATLDQCMQRVPASVFRQCMLGALSRSETNMLLCDLLGVVSVDPILPEKVHEKSRGNPYHAAQILAYLQQAHCIVIEGNECRVVDTKRLADLEVTSSMQNVMLARLEQITVRQQFVAKVASIAGHVFQESMLKVLLEKAAAQGVEHLGDDLSVLVHVGIFAMAQLEGEPDSQSCSAVFQFAQPLMQELIYKTLSSTIRTSLHIAAASWLIQTHQRDLDAHLGYIADHFLRAKRGKNAIRFLDLAVAKSFEQSKWHDCIHMLQLLLYLDDGESSQAKEVHWQTMLALCHYELGEFATTLQYVQMVCNMGSSLVGPVGLIDVESPCLSEVAAASKRPWSKIMRQRVPDYPEWYLRALLEMLTLALEVWILQGAPFLKTKGITKRVKHLWRAFRRGTHRLVLGGQNSSGNTKHMETRIAPPHPQ